MGGRVEKSSSRKSCEELEKSVREKLQNNEKINHTKSKTDGKKSSIHVFISFSEKDLKIVNLLRGQAKNEHSSLEFDDYSLHEPFDSQKADYIKQGIKKRIKMASVTLVYLTKNSAKSRWVDWEIQESIKQGKGIIGVYQGEKPKIFPGSFDKKNFKITEWKQKTLTKLIEEISKNDKK